MNEKCTITHDMITKKLIKYRTEPYFREAELLIFLDILCIALIVGVSVLIGVPVLLNLSFVMGYIALAFILYHKVTVRALIDRRHGDYITEILHIDQFDYEVHLATDRWGRGYVRYLYPALTKYRIKVTDSNGKKKQLRAIMSFGCSIRIFIVQDKIPMSLQVTYLKRSKILICMQVPEGVDIEKYMKKKEARQFYKTLHQINNQM